jgi:hypothetical protein
MTEPIHSMRQGSYRESSRGALSSPEPLDVLLIADDPVLSASDNGAFSSGRSTAPRGRASAEPLDMESVVRRLIALLSDDSEPWLR